MDAMMFKTWLVLTAAVSLLIAATVELPELTPLTPWQRLEQANIPAGNVEVRPMPPDWKPPPVWNGYFGDDRYGNYEPKGAAPTGWVHPSTLSLPLEVWSNSAGHGAPGYTQVEIGGEMRTVPKWFALEMLKREPAR